MSEEYYKVLHETDANQIRLTINEFRDIEYLHFRKYFLDFDGNWLPSKDGVSMPLSIANTQGLLEAMLDILALTESKTILEDHFKEQIDKIYDN
jgi:hypothetical protein